MTIDDHIKILKSYHNGFTGQVSDLEESIDIAVDIILKYQKIEKIWDKWHIDMSVKTNVAMSQIGEVLKNGNDD